MGKVTQQTLRHVIQRWNFGAYHIRRVASKFTRFNEHARDITSFLDSVKGEPFDSDMMIPGKRRWATKGRFINQSISCTERQRAYEMYRRGGPGRWMCSQSVLWALGFAGGLNLDYSDPYDNCKGPGWALTNLQEWPGSLLAETNLWDKKITWTMPCNQVSCWVGAPMSSRWIRGMPPISHPREIETTTTTIRAR